MTTDCLHSDNTYRYLDSKRDCDQCALKPGCYPNATSGRIPRDPNEAAWDVASELMEMDDYRRSRLKRKRIEALFGKAK